MLIFRLTVFYLVKIKRNWCIIRKERKLVWASDASNLKASNIGNFDFRAILTTGGVEDADRSNVKYVYTGIFYISSEPPAKPGFYVQTAWTKALAKYAFPITRSFKIAK